MGMILKCEATVIPFYFTSRQDDKPVHPESVQLKEAEERRNPAR